MSMGAFRSLARDWEAFGKTDPLFGILSDPAKHGGRWDVSEFFDSGRAHVQNLFAILRSRQIDFATGACLDFGCGVGRLTVPLSEPFARTVGVDVAPSMIRQARDYHRSRAGCEFVVNQAADLRQFPDATFDLVHSCLVLQHIVPEVSLGYVREFFRVAEAGGLVVFQLPAETRTEEEITAMLALPDDGYRASVLIHPPDTPFTATTPAMVRLTVTNASGTVWRHDLTAGRHITVANHWLRPDGTTAIYDDGRIRLPKTLAPGASVDVMLEVTAPADPGTYLLEIDLVQEAVCWFAQKGSATTRMAIRVDPVPAPVSTPAPESAAGARGRGGSRLDSGATGPMRILALTAPLGRFVARFRRPPRPAFSMYTVSRAEVEAVIRASGGELLAAIDDNAAGAGWLSYTYVCRRR